MERRFYAVELAYDGTRFRGFQRQPGLPTVQDAVEAALAAAGVRASLAVAARTDAGVHALAQVVSFSARAALDPDALRRALNAALPDGVLARAAHRVDPSFHARNSAVARGERRRPVDLAAVEHRGDAARVHGPEHLSGAAEEPLAAFELRVLLQGGLSASVRHRLRR